MNKHISLAILVLAIATLVSAQNTVPSYIDKGFSSLEFKVGKNGLLQIPVTPHVNVLYQKNIAKHLSVVCYSEIAKSIFNTDPDQKYLIINNFWWREAVGIGGTFGRKSFNNNLFLMAGGNYYRSHTFVDEALKPELITAKLRPELGLLYNLKWGKKRVYFSFQHYIPLYPLNLFLAKELTRATSVGIGLKLNQK
ncbi:hypothetical protein [Haliscomenobacter sp.]|uniref:hypothetical protein n=1 Tax=Haliscomenobacter sp. TaxID=2717303 RepID=UPI003BA996A1